MSRVRRRETKDSAAISPVRFAVTYVVAMGVLFLLLAFKPLQRIVDLNGLYTQMILFLTGQFAGLLNIPYSFSGSVLQLPSFALDIKFGCNGLEAVMIYSVAVAAVPLPVRSRVWGIIAGFIAIQVVNVIRLVALVYIGTHYWRAFRLVHIYIAQGMMIAVALGMFLLYLSYAGKGAKGTL